MSGNAPFEILKVVWEPVGGIEGLPDLPNNVQIQDLEPVQLPEKRLSGRQVLIQAKKLGINFGYNVARKLYRRKEELPAEWEHLFFLFPGTLLEFESGETFIPCLYCSDEWTLSFFMFKLERAFGEEFNGPLYQFLRVKNS